ncbi:hypothetical protein JTB14_030789 [Gonioctena quinquepunctata]|nr:hypothetical protein JTB14_030789 [Gonioctena quinquepunctata]
MTGTLIGPRKKYSQDQINAALEAVARGIPVATAAKIHSVPRVTLMYKSSEHCKGSENTIADVLSRFPLRKTSFAKPEVGNNVNIALMKLSNDFSMLKLHFKVLRTDQMNDEWIRNKIEFIENCQEGVEITNEKDRNILRWFVVHEGILFKRGDVRCPGFKLCVPQNQRRDIILAHHKALGHFGKTKTYLHMRNMFYWPKILKHVGQIVAACDLCQKAKCSPKSRGLLNPIITKKPGVCLDMIGPLPQGRGGVTQILVIVDAFPKFVKLYALLRATSKAIFNKIVKDYIPNVQKPECILSDNATQFTSELWKTTLGELGIRIEHISVYFPSGTITERYNKEIGRLLRLL